MRPFALLAIPCWSLPDPRLSFTKKCGKFNTREGGTDMVISTLSKNKKIQKQETPEKKTSKIFHTFCRRRSDLVWNFPLICFLKGSLTNNHSIFKFFKEHFMKHYRQIARKAVVLYKVGKGSYVSFYCAEIWQAL